MGLKKILKNLKNYLKQDIAENIAQRENIELLLGKLKNKQKKLKNNLGNEKNTDKTKKTKTELKVIALQLEKGRKLLEELEKKVE